jgi:hypothetical protein
MNKKLHFLFFCLLIIFILCLCKDKLIEPYGGSGRLTGSILENFKNIEPFGNQIVIHPDNAELNPKETTFSILTYDSDLNSGVTQASICSDDSEWRKDDKTCIDYSISGSNCEDIGSDGRLAFDACKVSCDNCNTYTEVKRRLPSPIEDVDEPSYAQFEGSISDGSTGSDIGGPDYREIISRLDDMKDSMGTLSGTVGAGVSAIQGESENMRIQLSSLTEGSELRDQLTRLDVDNDGFLSLGEIVSDLQLDDRLSGLRGGVAADISSREQMRPLIDNIKTRLAQFTNTLIILCESLKNNNGLSDDDKLLTTGGGVNIQDIIDELNEKSFNVVDNFSGSRQLFMNPANTAAIGAEQNMPYNIAFLYLVEKYRDLNITSIKQQFTSSVNEINTKITELFNILGQDADYTPGATGGSDADIQNKRNAALKLLDYSRGFNEFTDKVNKLSKILLVELNRIQSPTVATDGGGDIDARIAEAKAEGKAEAERENAEDDAAEAVAAEKEEKDDKITAAEVGLGVGAVGVLGYFAANALGFLE